MNPGLGMKLCDRCQCHEANFYFEYRHPMTRKTVHYDLCRPCQMMMVNWVEEAQGIRKG